MAPAGLQPERRAECGDWLVMSAPGSGWREGVRHTYYLGHTWERQTGGQA